MFTANIVWGLFSETDILSIHVHRSSDEDFTATAGTMIATLEPDVRKYTDVINVSGGAEMIYYRVEAKRATDSLVTESMPFVVGTIEITTPVITTADYIELTSTTARVELTSSPFEASFITEEHIYSSWELYDGERIVGAVNATQTALTENTFNISTAPTEIWSSPASRVIRSVVDVVGDVYRVARLSNVITKISSDDGGVMWSTSRNIPGAPSNIIYKNGVLLVTVRDRFITTGSEEGSVISGAIKCLERYDPLNGNLMWRYEFPESTDQFGLEIDVDGYIYINGNNNVRKLDMDRNVIWDSDVLINYPTDNIFNIRVSETNNVVYVGGGFRSDAAFERRGRLWALNRDTGELLWESQEYSGLYAMELDGDDNIVVVAVRSSGNDIVRISPTGTLVDTIINIIGSFIYEFDFDEEGYMYVVSSNTMYSIAKVEPVNGNILWSLRNFVDTVTYLPLDGTVIVSRPNNPGSIRKIQQPSIPENLTARVRYFGSTVRSEWSELYPINL